MNIEGCTALVTGANRGLGAEFVRQLCEQGALRVYAAARAPMSNPASGVVPLKLDVTFPRDIEAAVEQCADVDLVINNAGIATPVSLVADDALGQARAEMETNTWGPFALSTRFAPVLAQNGGGAIVNVLSVLSWVSLPTTAGYSMSKAAAWALTNSLRVELGAQGTLVVAVHAGFIDTDMAAHIDQPKIQPADVVAQTLDAVRSGQTEVLADDVTRMVKSSLSGPAS